MAAYATAADVEAFITAAFREAAFADSDGSYLSQTFDRAVQFASADVASRAKNAGYSIETNGDGTASDDLVRLAVVERIVRIAYARHQQEVPADLIAAFGGVPDAIRTGDMPLPDSDPDPENAVGGSRFSPTTGTDARPRVMDGLYESM